MNTKRKMCMNHPVVGGINKDMNLFHYLGT